MKKKGLEFSFAWIFAMIIGAVIIFIAIYATSQFVRTGRQQTDAQTTEQLGIILNKIQTSLEDASGQKITFADETRIYNKCREAGNFGEQVLSSSTRSGIGKEWQLPLTEKVFFDKYVFSSSIEQGKEIKVFVKQFDMPFRVADFAYFYTDKYCFVQPPGEIEDEINSLKLEGINVSFSNSGCSPGELKVCFSGVGCEINVNLQARTVTKEGKSFNYGDNDALMYGAIFSDYEIYECQLKRAMKRTGELAQLYASKADFLEGRGCDNGLSAELRNFASQTNLDSSSELEGVINLAKNLEIKNEKLSCEIF